jgi:hypothetical protein
VKNFTNSLFLLVAADPGPAFPDMANFFPRWSNMLPLWVIVGMLTIGGMVTAGVTYYFTPKYTRVGYTPSQPVPFSHKIHAGQLGMDCRYCHSFVEESGHANIPATQTCWNCHQHVKKDSPNLAKVAQSMETGEAIPWVKVHKVPDYAYFNHSVHVNRGVSCVECHGRVDEMTTVRHDQTLSMSWCLDCHRSPDQRLRPLDQITNLGWQPENVDRQALGEKLKKAWNIHPPESCGACHR